MANTENLIPLNKRTKSEQREIQSAAGHASGVTRRRQRDMKKAFLALLKKDWPTKQGPMTGAEMLALAKFKKAASGDVRALIDIEDRLYGKPTQAVELNVNKKAPEGAAAVLAKIREAAMAEK